MSIFTYIVGSGAGIIIIGVSVIAMGYLGHLPNFAQAILRRLFIVAMFAGGSALAVSGIGILWFGIASRVADLFGGFDTGPGRVAVVLGSVVLLLGTIAGLIWAPVEAVAMTAALLPAVLMLVPGGFLHQVYVATTAPAQAMAASFNAWIAG